jgi:predicted class III extradiol MEMO1 family dioxygenase
LIDTKVVGDLVHKHGFEVMSSEVDEEEHSLEMHLPYIYKMLAE